jgi:hypothetical protein
MTVSYATKSGPSPPPPNFHASLAIGHLLPPVQHGLTKSPTNQPFNLFSKIDDYGQAYTNESHFIANAGELE